MAWTPEQARKIVEKRWLEHMRSDACAELRREIVDEAEVDDVATQILLKLSDEAKRGLIRDDVELRDRAIAVRHAALSARPINTSHATRLNAIVNRILQAVGESAFMGPGGQDGALVPAPAKTTLPTLTQEDLTEIVAFVEWACGIIEGATDASKEDVAFFVERKILRRTDMRIAQGPGIGRTAVTMRVNRFMRRIEALPHRRRVHALVSVLVGTATVGQRSAVAQHLAGCSVCRLLHHTFASFVEPQVVEARMTIQRLNAWDRGLQRPLVITAGAGIAAGILLVSGLAALQGYGDHLPAHDLIRISEGDRVKILQPTALADDNTPTLFQHSLERDFEGEYTRVHSVDTQWKGDEGLLLYEGALHGKSHLPPVDDDTLVAISRADNGRYVAETLPWLAFSRPCPVRRTQSDGVIRFPQRLANGPLGSGCVIALNDTDSYASIASAWGIRRFQGVIVRHSQPGILVDVTFVRRGDLSIIGPSDVLERDESWQKDADHDGLPDALERILETAESIPDTDRDGLGDGEEVLTVGSNPKNPDTDGDGVGDAEEIRRGTHPLYRDNLAAIRQPETVTCTEYLAVYSHGIRRIAPAGMQGSANTLSLRQDLAFSVLKTRDWQYGESGAPVFFTRRSPEEHAEMVMLYFGGQRVYVGDPPRPGYWDPWPTGEALGYIYKTCPEGRRIDECVPILANRGWIGTSFGSILSDLVSLDYSGLTKVSLMIANSLRTRIVGYALWPECPRQ